MTKKKFASVWDAIEDSTEEAENMKLRSELMQAVKAQLLKQELSQSAAAKKLGVTQPRVSDLFRGKIDLFALDTLVAMATKVGLHIEMRITEPA